MRPTMDFPMARHFLRSWTYEVFWPRHVTSAETPKETVKVSNLQSRFIPNPCFISFIPVGSSWYSFVHKGSLLRVAYDLQPVVKCSWSFWSFAIPVELRESVFRVSKSRYANISHHFGTPSVSHKWNSKKKKNWLAHRKILDISFLLQP